MASPSRPSPAASPPSSAAAAPDSNDKFAASVGVANGGSDNEKSLESSLSKSFSPSPNVDPINDLERFIFQPPLHGSMVFCTVTRDRKGIGKGEFPTYFLHLQAADNKKVFLLAARKRKRQTSANYLISIDPTQLGRRSEAYAGKLRGNVLGTEYTIYDNGQGLKKKKIFDKAVPRQELCAIHYQLNPLGFRGPRKMTVLVPGLYPNHERVVIQPEREQDTLINRWARKDIDKLIQLSNKAPQWNEETQTFVLDFHGRVNQASVKNFQLIHAQDENYLVMQFGRVDNEHFTLDFNYPLCAIQAFGIALSSLDNKLGCE